MYSLKVLKDHQRREQEWDFRKVLTGEFMALFANANSKRTFKREDFFKLTQEQTEVIERPLTTKEVKEMLGSKIKKGNGKQ